MRGRANSVLTSWSRSSRLLSPGSSVTMLTTLTEFLQMPLSSRTAQSLSRVPASLEWTSTCGGTVVSRTCTALSLQHHYTQTFTTRLHLTDFYHHFHQYLPAGVCISVFAGECSAASSSGSALLHSSPVGHQVLQSPHSVHSTSLEQFCSSPAALMERHLPMANLCI